MRDPVGVVPLWGGADLSSGAVVSRVDRTGRVGATVLRSAADAVALLGGLDGDRAVVVHDPDRPVDGWAEVVRTGPAAAGAVAVTDTLKSYVGDEVVATVAREGLVDVVGPVVLSATAARRHVALLPDLAGLVQALRREGDVTVVELSG